MTEPAAELVAMAMDYPFSRPDHSFLFADGAVRTLAVETLDATLDQWGAAPMAERTAVLAYGANAAPERLRRKFADQAPGVVFPVLGARLFDFDIVYACHFSGYGALPATLAPSPGTVVEVAVTYLDRAQLARMHETELPSDNYVFGRLEKIILRLDGLADLHAVHSYWTAYGYFADDSGPVALSAVAAEGRRFAAAAQQAMQIRALEHLAPGHDLHRFIEENIADPGLRRQRGLVLRAKARPFDPSG